MVVESSGDVGDLDGGLGLLFLRLTSLYMSSSSLARLVAPDMLEEVVVECFLSIEIMGEVVPIFSHVAISLPPASKTFD